MKDTPPTHNHPAKWFALAGVGLGTLMSTLDASIVNISLPTLEKFFSTNFATVQWVVLSYALILTSLTLGVARLGDMINKKRLYLFGMALFTFGSFLCAMSPSIYYLIAFRAVQGLGAALVQALGFAIITEVFPAQERGKALGLMGSIVSIGIASGPPLGGLIIGTVGWHWVFLVNIPIGIMALIFITRFVPELHATNRNQRFDLAGAVIMFAVLSVYALAMTLGQDQGFTNTLVLSLLAVAFAGLVFFVWVEKNQKYPMIDLSLFKNFLFNLNLMMGFLTSIVLAGLFILPYYLELVKHYPELVVGLLMMVDPLAMGIVAPLAGSLSDRFGSRAISILGLIVISIGSLSLGSLQIGTSQVGFVLHMIPIGLGLGLFMAPNNSAIMGSVPKERLGITSGLLTLTRMLGQTTGLPLMGALFSAGVSAAAGLSIGSDVTSAPPAALVAGIEKAFHTAAFFVFASVVIAVLAFVIDRRQKKQLNDAGSLAGED
ncbi:MAG: MFS transporter [Anaerolineae bacterium]|nr:MFS transporter [Anaerolineae bacterium]